MPSKLDGIGLAAVATGTIFAYAGITGKSVLKSIQAMVSGQSPFKLAATNPISGTGNPNATPTGVGTVSGTTNGVAIANDALGYNGHAYVYGGSPGPNGTGGWDCSSFVNWVLGHDLHMSLPGGGTYNGNGHGPVASSYKSFGTGIPRASAQAGDLCVWETHIGIAINGSSMISALNPRLGTAVTGIESGGPGGETLTCRRISAG